MASSWPAWAAVGALAWAGTGCGDVSFEQGEVAVPGQTGRVRSGVFATSAGPQVLTYELVDGLMVFEGDIILSPDDLLPADRVTSALTTASATRYNGTKRWPDGVVPFTIDATLTNTVRVTDAIDHWEDNTPIRFVARTTETDFVTFRPSTGCSSSVGRSGGEQFINLATGCTTGNTIHEIGHALGLWHEQTRTDRDDHIIVDFDEVESGKEHNFETFLERGNDGRNVGAYDIGSIMHYGSYYFAVGSDPTITELDGTIIVANRTAVSQTDICGINAFYKFGRGSDFNGDGYADLVVGAAYEDLGGTDEGAITVIYGSSTGLTTTDQLLHRDQAGVEDSADSTDRFGYSITTGDFNGDCLDDVAIGVPYDDVSGLSYAGSVHVFYGSVLGLNTASDEVWHPDTSGIVGASEASAYFGRVTASGDFNGDGFHDLAIGTPYEDIGSITDTGVVNVIYGSSSGLTATGDQLWNQNSSGIQDISSTYEHFGYALATGDFDRDGFDELVVGVPGEEVSGQSSAGAIHIIQGSIDGLTSSGDQFYHEANGSLPDSAEASDQFGYALATGDFDGDGIDDLAIGVPYEDVGGVSNAGSVTVMYGTSTGISASGSEAWNQDTSGIIGVGEASDYFGRELTAEDFDGDGYLDLAIGVPYEDLGSTTNAGGVNVIYGSASGLTSTGDQFWSQDSSGIQGVAETYDYFGYRVATGDYNGDGYMDLAVGVPYEDVNGATDAGAVNVIYGGAAGLSSTGDEMWHQDSTGIQETAEAYDRFGYGL